MSAMGQKQFARCLLYLQKQTSLGVVSMSAKCQKRTRAVRQPTKSHSITSSAREQRRRAAPTLCG